MNIEQRLDRFRQSNTRVFSLNSQGRYINPTQGVSHKLATLGVAAALIIGTAMPNKAMADDVNNHPLLNKVGPKEAVFLKLLDSKVRTASHYSVQIFQNPFNKNTESSYKIPDEILNDHLLSQQEIARFGDLNYKFADLGYSLSFNKIEPVAETRAAKGLSLGDVFGTAASFTGYTFGAVARGISIVSKPIVNAAEQGVKAVAESDSVKAVNAGFQNGMHNGREAINHLNNHDGVSVTFN